MKKVFDRIWEWIKSTAWFQVVLLVGCVVAVVLCISPITQGINAAITEADRTKYYEHNRINYSQLISKINNLDNGGEEFAVMFISGLPSDDDNQKGVQKYMSEVSKPVKIYYLQTDVTEENKSNWNDDEKWYYNYLITTQQLQDLATAGSSNNVNHRKTVYGYWSEYTSRSDVAGVTEIAQDSTAFDSETSIPSNTLMWFRKSSNIDPEIKDYSTLSDPADASLGSNFNFHIAKIYTSFSDTVSSSDAKTKVCLGLQKFFNTSIVSAN
jgi:hypothetical protein